jgi:hypothetical protein
MNNPSLLAHGLISLYNFALMPDIKAREQREVSRSILHPQGLPLFSDNSTSLSSRASSLPMENHGVLHRPYLIRYGNKQLRMK